jgi:hypothetical protein
MRHFENGITTLGNVKHSNKILTEEICDCDMTQKSKRLARMFFFYELDPM